MRKYPGYEGGRRKRERLIAGFNFPHTTPNGAALLADHKGGASVRGKQELSVRGKGKICSMWKKADLCTTWKVFYCLYVEKTLCLHNVENGQQE